MATKNSINSSPVVGNNTGDETATSIGVLIGGAADATPNDTDFVATSLTAGGILKKITWTNVKAFLKTYFDTIYQAAGAYITASSTNTLTNKRISKRNSSISYNANPTYNTDNTDVLMMLSLTGDISSMTTNKTGNPAWNDMIEFIFLDNGTPRSITWGAGFASTTVTLPTTTVASTQLRVLCQYDDDAIIWKCIAVA